MTPIAILFTVLAAIAVIVLGVLVLVYLVVPVLRGIGWLLRHIFRFFRNMITDAARFIGSVVMMPIYTLLVVANLVVARWSASAHYGRQFAHEAGAAGACLYRLVVGHPLRLFGLQGIVEGLERRLPAALAAEPVTDAIGSRASQFEGYRIVGSLPPGGSGARLYIAEPDSARQRDLAARGHADVSRVVIKSFALAEGSSLPQIVRESRSLDAARRLGLILDHHLAPDRFYYVMRYVPGESLSSMMRTLHAQSPSGGLGDAQLRSALSYVSDLLTTLAAYHRGGLWHKDVKPDNVIIDEHGRAHLVDFGLVTSLRSAMTLTTHGTEYFRDPEMVRLALRGVKVHEVDGTRFDVYSAGAVLYSVIEDSFPAHGALSQITKRCPEAVKWIIRRAMTDYDRRYASVEAMLGDLEAVRVAPDPFGVRPADLPSMRGDAAQAAHAGGESPAPGPLPGVDAGPVPSRPVATRSAPVIEVANWWTGRARVAGTRPHGSSAGVAAPIGADPDRVAGRATPVPPPRRPAHEQLASARARVEARRSRVAGSPMPGRDPGVSLNRGVIAAVLIVGVLVGANFLRNAFIEKKGEVVASTDGRTPGGKPSPDVRSAGIKPVRATGRVLVVCDLLRPWDRSADERIREVLTRVEASGMTLRGNLPDADATPGDVEAIASLRLAVGEVPRDSEEAATRVRRWLVANPGEADAVIWVAPVAGESVPRVLAFVPDGEELDGRRAAIAAAVARDATRMR
jgi:hypothetical protein